MLHQIGFRSIDLTSGNEIAQLVISKIECSQFDEITIGASHCYACYIVKLDYFEFDFWGFKKRNLYE